MIEIQLKGTSALIKNLQNKNSKIGLGLDKAIQDFALNIESKAIDNIRAGGNPSVPLKPKTLKQKMKLGFSPIPLIRTGEMMQKTRSSRMEFQSAKVEVMTDYAAYHELGAPTAGIPERPFLRPAIQSSRSKFEEDVKKLGEK